MKEKIALASCASCPKCPCKLYETELSYRVPMKVSVMKLFWPFQGRNGYYVCPKCSALLDREFMAFCGRCGQRLDWSAYKKVRIIRRTT